MRGGGGKGFTSVLLSAFQNYGVGFYRKMTSGRPVSLKYNKDEKYYNSFMFIYLDIFSTTEGLITCAKRQF